MFQAEGKKKDAHSCQDMSVAARRDEEETRKSRVTIRRTIEFLGEKMILNVMKKQRSVFLSLHQRDNFWESFFFGGKDLVAGDREASRNLSLAEDATIRSWKKKKTAALTSLTCPQ